MPKFSPIRAGIVLFVLAGVLAGMIGRVAYLETFGRQHIIRRADRQQYTILAILARRGSIFDRNGHELVGTVQSLIVYIDPHFLFQQVDAGKYTNAQLEIEIRKLADIVNCNPTELLAMIREDKSRKFIKIAEKQPDRAYAAVLELKIPGVGVQPECVRYYPMGALAAHVLGGVGADGQGLDGIELKFQAELAGRDGEKRFEKDAQRRPLSIEEGDYTPPIHGQHLVLTIDSNIQMMAEQELAAVCREKEAERGEAIVMDPRTGEVLALANWPTFNPADSDAPLDLRRNSTLVMPYEPGSIFKPFIMGPALEKHVTRINEVWPTSAGPFMIGSRAVRDVHPSGAHLCSWDVIVKSSNQGMTMVSLRFGNPAIWRAIRTFGFGQRTGIELPGENDGLVKPLREWTSADTPSVAQGYAVMVTPLQLARAFCVYANGGRLVNVHIVKGHLGADGKLIERYPNQRLEDLPQVLDPQTVQTMLRILADVPIRGTGTEARKQCPWWNIFGKTGTAHISLGRQGYSPSQYNSSFLCGAPVENPRVIVAMTVHKPSPRKGSVYGGAVTAPAAGKLIRRVLAYMQVPTSPAPTPPPAEVIPVLFNFHQALYTEPKVVASNR